MSTTVDLGKITASVTVGTTTTGAAGTNASVSNSGTTQDAVLNFTIPRGAQGVQGPQGSTGPQGPAGPTGPQGPMGDVAVITPEQQAAFTMYSVPGQNTDGPMTQKAVTDALVASAISYDNSASGLASNNVQGALDETIDGLWDEDTNNRNLGTVHNYIIGSNSSAGKYVTASGYQCYTQVVYSGEKYKIKANSGRGCYYAFMTSNPSNPQSGTNVDFVEGHNQKYHIPLGETGVFTVPESSGKIYLYIQKQSSGNDFTPDYLHIYIPKIARITNSMLDEILGIYSLVNVIGNDFVSGYYNRSGSLVSDASYNSGKISVEHGQVLFYRTRVSSGFDPYACRVSAFDSDDNFIASASVMGNTQTVEYINGIYVVPQGVRYVCVSSNARYDVYAKVCDFKLLDIVNNEDLFAYYVGPNRPNKSLIGLFESLKGNDKEKTIYIDAGTYDIFQDYINNNITPPRNGQTNTADYFDYNSFLPPNTKLVGLGKVILQMKPTKQQLLNYAGSLSDTTDVNARASIISKIWSPINIGGSCEIENITIEAQNVRYCIHDDMHGADVNSIHSYHNVHCMMDIPEEIDGTILGLAHTVGMGWASGSRHEYNDCVFENKNQKRAFYGHGTPDKGSTLTFNHCAFIGDSNYNDSVNFQTLSSDIYSKVLMAGCYIMGTIHLQLYTGATHNSFDLTTLNCNQIVGTNPKYRIDDLNNPYPIKEY